MDVWCHLMSYFAVCSLILGGGEEKRVEVSERGLKVVMGDMEVKGMWRLVIGEWR